MKTSNNAIKVAVISGLVCLLVYLRALTCSFVNLDDPLYVLNNPIIRQLDWDFISSIFTQTYENWWMPLTWISLAIDFHFWELNPFGYHLTNIVLHAVNTGLVVLVADRVIRVERKGEGVRSSEFNASPQLLLDQSYLNNQYMYSATLIIAGLLWGIHPLRVESVAWVSERKDVLNGMFALASILCYLRYAQLKESGMVKVLSRYYFLTLGLFILSLMAKSVTVVVPAVLLVLDWYPLGRLHKGSIRSVLMEKIPFLVVSAAMSAVTIFFIAEAQYLVSNANFPFEQRLIVSGNALFEYCRLMIYPFGIVPYYLIPDPIPFAYSVKTAVVVVISIWCLFTAKRRSAVAAVLLCFVLLMLPVLAFFQNGDQSLASRFTYLPSIAPCIAAAFGSVTLFMKYDDGRRLLRSALQVLVVFLLLFYAGMTQKLIVVWSDSESMWNRVVEIEPSAIAFKERALSFMEVGKYNAAVDDFTSAIRNPLNIWQPYVYNLYAFRGEALRMAGRYDEAVKDFTAAIGMLPHPVYYRLRGISLRESGRMSEAEDDFKRAGGEIAPLAWFWSKAKTLKN